MPAPGRSICASANASVATRDHPGGPAGRALRLRMRPAVRRPAQREGWRRALHAASVVIAPVAAWLPPPVASYGFAALVLLAVGLETARLAARERRGPVERFAGPLFRPAESGAVSGASTLALGYALTWWLFPGPAAARAIAVAAIADPVAAAIGTHFAPGSERKTWIGSAAFALAAGVALLLASVPPASAAAASAASALAERVPWRTSDNVAVPVLTAAVLTWLA